MEKLSLRKNLTDDLLERWPKDAEGEPEEAVFLCNCRAQDMSETWHGYLCSCQQSRRS